MSSKFDISNFAKVKDSELSELLEGLTIECDTTILNKVGDFSLSEEKIHLFPGLTWENIISKMLFNFIGELMLICDGTYARHQKSSNIEYPRKSYSGQKKVPLCKPFTNCTTTGRVLDIAGPFYTNQNGVEILKNLI